MNTPQEFWSLFAPKRDDASLNGQLKRLRRKRQRVRDNLRRLMAKPHGVVDRRISMWWGVMDKIFDAALKLASADMRQFVARCRVGWRIADGNGGME